MPYYLLILIIIYVGAIPGIVIGGIQEKKGVPSKAVATFMAPDGTKRQVQFDVTWSWTVYVFRGWALAFRGQFIPFLIIMLTTIFTFSGFGITGLWWAGTGGIQSTVSEVVGGATSQEITLTLLFMGGYLFAINYYVAFANKERILAQINRGFDFSQTPELAALYKYVGHVPRTKPEPNTNIQSGKSHDYVVPDAVVKKEVEDNHDYSMLTVNDLKLLLKSEGIPYTTSDTKEVLLELVEEFIAAPARKEESKVKSEVEKAKEEAAKAIAEAKAAKEEAEKLMAEAEEIKAKATSETRISSKKKEDNQ